MPMGQWFVGALSGTGDLDLPERADAERDTPFDD